MMSENTSVFVMMAMQASAEPSASDPVSPMKMSAGYALNHKKPTHAPAMVAANTAIGSIFSRYAIAAMTIMTTMTVPAAKPSRPSVKFTALDMPMMSK